MSNFSYHLVGASPYDMKLIRVIALFYAITMFRYIENILNKEDIIQADIPCRIVFTLFVKCSLIGCLEISEHIMFTQMTVYISDI